VDQDERKKTIGKAIGRIPSGVFILTAGSTESTAMMASWVQQAGFEPPTVSVAIAKARPIGEIIRRDKRFILNVIGETDHHLMRKYARGVPEGEDPFASVNVTRLDSGGVVLAECLAYIECSLISVCDYGGDHQLFIAQVVSGKMLREGQSFTHVRGSGFHY
jgi:flavin reductase (DIM6/NTAB) family NADH-FMN oxidoreductase RutF